MIRCYSEDKKTPGYENQERGGALNPIQEISRSRGMGSVAEKTDDEDVKQSNSRVLKATIPVKLLMLFGLISFGRSCLSRLLYSTDCSLSLFA